MGMIPTILEQMLSAANGPHALRPWVYTNAKNTLTGRRELIGSAASFTYSRDVPRHFGKPKSIRPAETYRGARRNARRGRRMLELIAKRSRVNG